MMPRRGRVPRPLDKSGMPRVRSYGRGPVVSGDKSDTVKVGNGGRDRDRTCDPYDVNVNSALDAASTLKANIIRYLTEWL